MSVFKWLMDRLLGPEDAEPEAVPAPPKRAHRTRAIRSRGRPGARVWLESRPQIRAQVDRALADGVGHRTIVAWLQAEKGFPFGRDAIRRYAGRKANSPHRKNKEAATRGA